MQQTVINKILTELATWAKGASDLELRAKRERLDTVRRFGLEQTVSDLNKAISVIDNEMNDRCYLQKQGADSLAA